MKNIKIVIDPEFKSVIPPLTAEELQSLEENIKTNGCLSPLLTWETQVLNVELPDIPDIPVDEPLVDGHNRFEICEKHKIPYKVKSLSFDSKDDAKAFIIKNQFGRRNLTPFQRAELAFELEKYIKLPKSKKACPKCKTLHGARTLQCDCGHKFDDHTPHNSRQEAGKIVGLSVGIMARAKTVQEKATEEIKTKLRAGEISISEAFKQVHNPHVSLNSGENEWYTPPDYIAAATAVLGEIELDPASSDIAQKTVKAKTFYTKDRDGLCEKWQGKTWMNPPYDSRLIDKFIYKFVEHASTKEITEGIVLVNNATETDWFQNLTKVTSMICFPSKRIKFLDPQGRPGAPLQGQAILYIGHNPKVFSDNFKQFGFITEVNND